MAGIRLIVGVGNPGPRYEGTRHNVGAWWVETLATRFAIDLATDARFKGIIGRGCIAGVDVRLLLPTTYMNLSGQAVGAMAGFFKMAPNEILVAHDEVAFPVGVAKLKVGGGHNGHNGLKSIVSSLGNAAGFSRLRIGLGHPGADRLVGYLTSVRMPRADRELVAASIDMDDELLGEILSGEMQQAMNRFHAPEGSAKDAR